MRLLLSRLATGWQLNPGLLLAGINACRGACWAFAGHPEGWDMPVRRCLRFLLAKIAPVRKRRAQAARAVRAGRPILPSSFSCDNDPE